MNIANIVKGGLRLQNKTLNLNLFSKKSFTICVVMQLWLNRSMSIKTFMRNEADEKPHLIYDKTTKKLTLQTNGLKVGTTNETSVTLLNSFNGKRVVLWLTKKGTGGTPTVKASISNHSATLTLSSALASQSNYTFRISSEDAVINKEMYSPNFYDLDSIEFHTIMLTDLDIIFFSNIIRNSYDMIFSVIYRPLSYLMSFHKTPHTRLLLNDHALGHN